MARLTRPTAAAARTSTAPSRISATCGTTRVDASGAGRGSWLAETPSSSGAAVLPQINRTHQIRIAGLGGMHRLERERTYGATALDRTPVIIHRFQRARRPSIHGFSDRIMPPVLPKDRLTRSSTNHD